MANEQNLIPYTSEQSREEAVKNGKKGGIASGAARRAKRDAREWARIALEELVKDKKSGAEVPTRLAMVKKQIQKAINNGDTKAFEKVLRLAGEWEQENNNNVTIVNNYNGISAEAADALRHINEL